MVSLNLERLLFVVSRRDIAGLNMAKYLKKLFPFSSMSSNLVVFNDNRWFLLYVDEDIIYADNVEKRIDKDIDAVIFLSRHSSTSNLSTLSVHTTGNPVEEAFYGGKPLELANSHPILMSSVLIYLAKLREDRGLVYDVTLEVTHHGPTDISKPSFFLEIGSTTRQWNDQEAVKTAIDALLYAIDDPVFSKPAVGFGGPHYAPTFTKYVLSGGYAFGHILSKYVLEKVDEDIILDAFRKTMGSKSAVLNWKGIRGVTRKSLYWFLVEKGFEVVRA